MAMASPHLNPADVAGVQRAEGQIGLQQSENAEKEESR